MDEAKTEDQAAADDEQKTAALGVDNSEDEPDTDTSADEGDDDDGDD